MARDSYKQIHLVTGKEPPVKEDRPNTRLLLGDHFADIVINRGDQDHPIYYWIIQKVGSADVVFWGQDRSFAQAQETAQRMLESILRKSQRKNPA